MMVPPKVFVFWGISLDFGKARVVVFLSLSLVLERKSNNTLERFHSRRPEEDPKENDNSKKKQSAFLLCRDNLRRRLQKKRVFCGTF